MYLEVLHWIDCGDNVGSANSVLYSAENRDSDLLLAFSVVKIGCVLCSEMLFCVFCLQQVVIRVAFQ